MYRCNCCSRDSSHTEGDHQRSMAGETTSMRGRLRKTIILIASTTLREVPQPVVSRVFDEVTGKIPALSGTRAQCPEFFSRSLITRILQKSLTSLDHPIYGQSAQLQALQALSNVQPPQIVVGRWTIGRSPGWIRIEVWNLCHRSRASCVQQQLGVGHLINKEGHDHHRFSPQETLRGTTPAAVRENAIYEIAGQKCWLGQPGAKVKGRVLELFIGKKRLSFLLETPNDGDIVRRKLFKCLPQELYHPILHHNHRSRGYH
mmetsp:Transcript_7330/g.17921  ORF Transcript_7330/g.17921 Transcript_7330/m.17921 type:complete len:260 (+) Transcript_7330:164-943(+)